VKFQMMAIRTPALALVIALASGLAVQAQPAAQAPGSIIAAAQPGDVRLLISNGLRVPFEAVKSQAEAKIGHKIRVEYGASRRLIATIEADQPFEVTILSREVVQEMMAKGKLRKGVAVDLARVPVAVAQRGGTPGDVGTDEALKALLLGAKVIHFTGIGASRPTIDNTLAKLGIADALKDRLDGSTSSQMVKGPDLAAGEYELILNLTSEIVPVTGWTYLGPIPQHLQVPVLMTAGIGAAGDAESAKAIIAFLQGPAIEQPLKDSRLSR
jgi:molybdate transport system substrate-binding protein